jgi:hypothetical protein
MSDYDKRYESVEEMLGDIEAILRAKDVTSIRPAQLPSMSQESFVLDEVEYEKSVPKRTTPSTGGGPFPKPKVYVYKTKPLGVVVAFIIGLVIYLGLTSTDSTSSLQIETIETTASIFDHQRPSGRVLLLDDCAVASDPKKCEAEATRVVEKLTALGWDIM